MQECIHCLRAYHGGSVWAPLKGKGSSLQDFNKDTNGLVIAIIIRRKNDGNIPSLVEGLKHYLVWPFLLTAVNSETFDGVTRLIFIIVITALSQYNLIVKRLTTIPAEKAKITVLN